MRKQRDDRNAAIVRAYLTTPVTTEDLAKRYAVTSQSINLVLKRAGYRRKDGYRAKQRVVRVAAAKDKMLAQHDRTAQEIYGCTYAEYLAIRDSNRRRPPTRDYIYDRRNAKLRGSRWGITLPQWVAMWRQAGLLGHRGRRLFRMQLVDEKKGFVPGNIRILRLGLEGNT